MWYLFSNKESEEVRTKGYLVEDDYQHLISPSCSITSEQKLTKRNKICKVDRLI